ncbi:MAG TPA: hypothetical protein PKE51_12695 [Gemmatimonadaceae bacterium]|nr:hypothetical protein [Gemmatimonadaceae bacterium]
MTGRRGVGRAVVLFAAAQLVVLPLVGVGLWQFFRAPGDLAALMAAGWVALGVQVLTFAIVRLVGHENVIAAWGVGVLVRFAVVMLWALLLVPAFGLAETPALIGLVGFFFVSTVIEPLFLNI